MTSISTAPAAAPVEELAAGYPSPLKEFWQGFSHNKGAVAGLVFMSIVAFCALFAPWIAPYDPIEQFRDYFLTPPAWAAGGSSQFLLGTDELGRDLLSRMIYGTRTTLTVALAATVISFSLGI